MRYGISVRALVDTEVFVGEVGIKGGYTLCTIGDARRDVDNEGDGGKWSEVGYAMFVEIPKEETNIAFVNVHFPACAILELFPQ